MAAGTPNCRPVPEPSIRTRQQWGSIIGLTTTDADGGKIGRVVRAQRSCPSPAKPVSTPVTGGARATTASLPPVPSPGPMYCG
ncbi:MAG TPA: hypothetical protein VGD83_13195, partial [Streptosporangiaceae bacterium]